MHRIVPLAALGAVFAFATPAVAQYYPASPVPPSGYGNGYGYDHGSWEQVRQLRIQIEGIRRQIDGLDRHDTISGRTADHLLDQANRIDRRLRDRARGGLDPREAGDIQYRLQRLEQQVQWARERRWERFRDWR